MHTINKIRDISDVIKGFNALEFLEETEVDDVSLGEGIVTIDLSTKQELFYEILEEQSGFKIEGDCQLLNLLTKLSKVKV